MGIRIPDLLAGILDATAAKTAATARIDGLRAALERIAVDRLANDGAAPTWKAPGAGVVRYDPPGPWSATVADPAAFGSFVAEHYPSEATAVIRLPADQLEAALQALEFAGIVNPAERVADVEVRPAWSSSYLAGLTVDVEETADDAGAVLSREFTITDDKGLLVDGVAGTRANGKLVVTMDRDRRTSVVDAALAEAKATVAAAVGVDTPAPVDAVEAREGRTVTIDELVGAGIVKPASSLDRPPAPEFTPEEAATVERFATAPDALEEGIMRVTPTRSQIVPEGHLRITVDVAPPKPAEPTGLGAVVEDDKGRPWTRCGLDMDDAQNWWNEQRGWNEWVAIDAVRVLSEGTISDLATPEAIERHTGKTVEEHAADAREDGIAAIEALDNREALRRIAKARNVSAAGTKREVAERLHADGFRA